MNKLQSELKKQQLARAADALVRYETDIFDHSAGYNVIRYYSSGLLSVKDEYHSEFLSTCVTFTNSMYYIVLRFAKDKKLKVNNA